MSGQKEFILVKNRRVILQMQAPLQNFPASPRQTNLQKQLVLAKTRVCSATQALARRLDKQTQLRPANKVQVSHLGRLPQLDPHHRVTLGQVALLDCSLVPINRKERIPQILTASSDTSVLQNLPHRTRVEQRRQAIHSAASLSLQVVVLSDQASHSNRMQQVQARSPQAVFLGLPRVCPAQTFSATKSTRPFLEVIYSVT